MTRPLLDIDGLSIAAGERPIVEPVSLSLAEGGVLGLLGESGSGKTMIGRAILKLLPAGVRIAGGDIRLDGESLLRLDAKAMRAVRGGKIGMVFQEPMTSLNPALRIGDQMMEALRLHQRLDASEAKRRCLAMLERVGLADPDWAFGAFSYQFSGGMRQRIMLASVLATRPRLLIADEPTTALDAIARKQVMDLMAGLTRETGTAVLLISHDLGMVSQYADQVAVLRRGQLIEAGTPGAILLNPKHAYTRALVGALPRREEGAAQPKDSAEPLVEFEQVSIGYAETQPLFGRAKRRTIVEGLTLDIRRGETLAIVGESGSGKTTTGRALLRLLDHGAGSIRFDGEPLDALRGGRWRAFRRRTQMVFQDPYSSLDPRMRLEEIVAEPLRHDAGLSRAERLERARAMLEEVGLSREQGRRFPHELSGGQRQRVCIARAIVGGPDFICADEPVSALDVTVQRQVLELLARLKARYGFTTLFVSHDLGVVEQVADRVAVMRRGRIVELAPCDALFERPRHPYTIRLLAATPRLAERPEGGYALVAAEAEASAPPEGRAWWDPQDAESATPELVEIAPRHWAACAA